MADKIRFTTEAVPEALIVLDHRSYVDEDGDLVWQVRKPGNAVWHTLAGVCASGAPWGQHAVPDNLGIDTVDGFVFKAA